MRAVQQVDRLRRGLDVDAVHRQLLLEHAKGPVRLAAGAPVEVRCTVHEQPGVVEGAGHAAVAIDTGGGHGPNLTR